MDKKIVIIKLKSSFLRLLMVTMFCIFTLSLSACFSDSKKNADDIDSIITYRDIPGVTAEEIAAIEALKTGGRSFSYGALFSTEAYLSSDGLLTGYTPAFCDLLSQLFDIQFVPELLEWNTLKSMLDNRTLDFTGDLVLTAERRQIYFMTHPVAQRSLTVFTYGDSIKIDTEFDLNGLRIGFLEGSVTAGLVLDNYPSLKFEIVGVPNTLEAVRDLEAGIIDAFVIESIEKIVIQGYPQLHSADVLPFTYNPVSMATANPDLKPLISVVGKYIEAGGIDKLFEMYKIGMYEYAKYELDRAYTPTEAAYISALVNSGAQVPVGLEHDYYPVCFFNEKDNEFQGVVPEILKEISLLTGIEFYTATGEDTPFYKILDMVNTGEVSFVSALLMTPERRNRYLWSERYYTSHYALISKIDYPFLEMHQVVRARVGVNRGSAYEEMYNSWFTNNTNLIFYDSIIAAMMALDRDEVDLVMASENALITMTNYFENPGFMINIRFNVLEEAYFGFNNNEEILASIIRKSQKYIAIDKINKYWTNRVFDYSRKLAEAHRQWLIGATALSLIIIALLLVIFYWNYNEGKMLAKLVAEKTSTLTAIINATPDLIFCKDTNLRITECNKSIEYHFNVNKSDIIGKSDKEAFGLSDELAAQYADADNRIFNEKDRIIMEEFIPFFDGKMVLFETIKTPLIQDGNVIGLVGMARDITQRKTMEEKDRNATIAKSHFLATMNHEMRTPMNAIVGLTELMLDETNVPGNIMETLKKISTAGNTLMELINNVLDISKIESGKLELTPVRYDFASLLYDVITLNMIRIEDKPVKFKLDINEDFPTAVFGDDLRVKQILNNLLSNAFKYTEEGIVTLGVDYWHNTIYENDDVWVSIIISDTGIGITEEDMNKLFSDYIQVDTRANRNIVGTGLGLSITKNLVELMDGQIFVESEYGKGSVFRVRLHQKFVTDQGIGKEMAENLRNLRHLEGNRKSDKKREKPDLSYARVLVVDDFPVNLDVAAGMLRKYKMQVDCVMSGQETVDLISAGEPVYDAIFMDHMMPGMDGLEATLKIRALDTEYARKIPIIALTANAVAGNEQMFLENGFSEFLPKPFSAANLDVVVERWVRDKSKEQ
jgi:PAS domain S-box-containing protein